MANQHVEINQGMRLGSRLYSVVSSLTAVHNNMADIKAIAEQVAFGGDWEAFQSEFGLPPGTGDTVYNLLVAAFGCVDEPAVHQFMERLG